MVFHLFGPVLRPAVDLFEHEYEPGGGGEVGLVPVSPHKLQISCPLELSRLSSETNHNLKFISNNFQSWAEMLTFNWYCEVCCCVTPKIYYAVCPIIENVLCNLSPHSLGIIYLLLLLDNFPDPQLGLGAGHRHEGPGLGVGAARRGARSQDQVVNHLPGWV